MPLLPPLNKRPGWIRAGCRQACPDAEKLRGKSYNPGMNFYIQLEDELILSLFLEEDDYADLKAYLRDQPVIEKFSERGMAFDHALDPHAVVETLRHSELVLKVAHEAMQLGKEAMRPAIGSPVTAWVLKRNEKKKAEIEAKESELLLFDQYGHRLHIRPESKKRNKR
jgi:hypothetical protein